VPKITILKGLPASGKSTWAKLEVTANQGKVKRINKDDLRAMIDGGAWSKEREKLIVNVRNGLIYQFTQAGYDVIVDDTNLDPKHEKNIRELFGQTNEVVVKTFDVTLSEAIRRDRARSNPVGANVIRRMYNQYFKPKAYVPSLPMMPRCIIVDIDGTVALMNGRSPYDTSKADTDLPNPPVVDLVRRYAEYGIPIVFMSGREEKYRDLTEKWLQDNVMGVAGINAYLFMRPTGDTREDSIVKKELFEKYVASLYNPLFVLDDRNRVVDMWRSLGLTVLQVAEGDF
jgi:predicted kinase